MGSRSSISELESIEKPRISELNDSYEFENLVENLKQMLLRPINPCLFSQIDIIKTKPDRPELTAFALTSYLTMRHN